MNIATTTAFPEIASWNNKIFAFGYDGESFDEDAMDARIEQTLAAFGDPLDPADPCSQFACTSYVPFLF